VSNSNTLSAADWATIIAMASRGEKTARDLADMFQVSPQAIHQGLRKRGVTFGSRVHEVAKEVEDEATAARKKRVQEGQKKAEDYSKRLDLVVQLTVKKIVDANQAGTLASVNGDIITLKNAIATISKGRQEHWEIHKIDELLQENEELAELNVGEYTEDELEAIRAANEEAFNESLDGEFNLDAEDDDEEDDEA
jgi:predicted DNA binding protein